jgi:lipopolysaccharide/colanic/teichoic acid biosynthesis glycosyltransferase
MQTFWLSGGKRTFDTAIILLFSPTLLLVLALLTVIVRLIDGPNPIFRQKRVGLNGRHFAIFKLRTMHPHASPPAGWTFIGWTAHGDPRITRLGRFLRRYRMDEIPQIWNVLRGEMALVGPRPETPEVSDQLAVALEGYLDRYLVRPGLTGLCQISSDYSDVGTLEGAKRKLKHDLIYVRSISPAVDFTVLARTFSVILRGRGVS